MNNLYEVLEICLQDLEQGVDIETILFRYPELADELRPILEASLNARSMAIVAPPAEVVRRNRAKVLQHAAQLRETKVKSPSQRVWFASLRRLAVTLVVVVALFVSGTGLVSAASTTLPGDNLYPVKRTWEDVLLLLTFNLHERETLEIKHENERLQELWELFAEGRSAEVEFSGLVTSQNGNEWMIAGIPVVISTQTEVRDGPIMIGSAVRVKGQTYGGGIVQAERVRLLPPGAKLPDEVEVEEEDHEGPDQQHEDNSGKGSDGEESKVEETETPESQESKDDSSNSGSGSDNSGSGSNDNDDEGGGSREANSGSSNDDNSNKGSTDDNSGSDNSGHGSDDSGSRDSSDDSGGGDNSGSGGGDDGDDD